MCCRAYQLNLCVSILLMFVSLNGNAATFNGFTQGALDVSPSGAATYTIPIEVPDGVNKFKPNVSLVYNSQLGNGLLGVGWSLSGISKITRCPSTYDQDGLKGGVYLDTRDRFCLDGQRLYVVDGVGYGSPGAKYRTEIDGKALVKSFNTSGTGPRYFEVIQPDGTKLEYGRYGTSAIKSTSSDTILVWSISKITDSAGNSISFQYTSDANYISQGYYPLQKIEYFAVQSTYHASIVFSYENRQDKIEHYVAGSKSSILERLSAVKIQTNNKTTKEYRLNYEQGNATGRSRLIGAEECNGEIGITKTCRSILRFHWKQENKGWVKESNQLIPQEWTDVYGSDWGSYGNFVDLNGDGLVDFVVRYFKSATDQRQGAWINTGNGWIKQNQWITPEWTNVYGWYGEYGKFIDLNGDGLVDYVVKYWRSSSDQRQGAWLNTGNGWSANQPQWIPPEWTGVNDPKWGQNGRYVDLNGDGLVDFVIRYFKSATDQRQGAWINTGNGWERKNQWIPPEWTDVHGWYGDYGKFIDLNGDGLLDYVVKYFASSTDQRQGAWLNTGNGWSSNQSQWIPPEWTGVNDSKWGQNGRYVDLNGDGLVDFVIRYFKSATDQRQGAWINTGNGWERKNQWIPPEWTDVHGWYGDYGKFIDLNGDGLLDYVVKYFASSTDQRQGAWLNTGNGWSSNQSQWIPPEWTGVNNADWGQNGRYVDLNGDGLKDFAINYFHTSSDQRRGVWTNNLGQPDKLESITQENGSNISIVYESLSNPNTTIYTKTKNSQYPFQDVQNSMSVVSNVVSDDGIGGVKTNFYHYEGLKFHLRGRGSLGFSKITRTNKAANTVTTTEYFQQTTAADSYTLVPGASDFWKTGRVKKTRTTVNGVLVNETTNNWDVVVTDANTLIPYAHQSVQKTYNYDVPGSLLSQVTTTVPAWPSGIDNWGNITESTTVTTDATTGKTYIQTTNATYSPADTVNWLIGLPQTQTVYNRVPDGRDGSSGYLENRIKKEWTYYPGTAKVWTETIKPGDSQYQAGDNYLQVTKTYEYDPTYGYKNKVTITGAGIDTPRVTTTNIDYNYISPDGLTDVYEITITNAKGHQEKRVVDMRTGKTLQLRGPNQLAINSAQGTDYKTQWFYDGFGRKLLERRADGNETRWVYNWCDTNCLFNNEVYYVRVSADGKPTKTVYYDKLGRSVRTEKTGFLGSLINARTQYDSLGRVKGVTKNYFRRGGTAYWTCTKYDSLGRTIKTSVPTTAGCGNVDSLPDYSTSTYNGLYSATTVYNDGTAGNQTKQRWKNVLGQVVKIKDALNYQATYAYNAIGKLIEVKDPLGNKVKTTYDRRGRKLTMDDPDMGHWEYGYNALGEMTWQKDAKGQQVQLHYDALGRLNWREEPGGTETRWYYDTAPHGIGKLDYVENAASVYSRHYEYDDFGRPAAVQTEILAQFYRIDTTYDTFGRVETTTYPDTDPSASVRRFAVQNHYDNYGHLQQVTQVGASKVFWTAHDRNADGKVVDETLGSNIDTVYTYEEIFGRLTYISSAAGQNLQDSRFVYDTIGNLEERDFMSGNSTAQDVTETFTYDGLNRLKSATVAGSPTKTYDYNAIGNITQKSDYGDTYHYTPSGNDAIRPHAVNTITNGGAQIASYAYDANGNMWQRQVSNGTDITIDYTWFNKPSRITATGKQSDFSYDDQHMRIMQTTEHGVTIYLNPRRDLGGHYEKEIENGITKHKHTIYGATGAVAIYTIREDTGQETTQYMLKDHLGSVEAIVNEDGTIHKRFSYDAFGKRRLLTGLDSTSFIVENEFHHGFTGHEHLDQFELIHMNGRLYDPSAARFMSADPMVKFASSTQGFNRYSYTDNNPLSRVDLNGYGWWSDTKKKLKHAWNKIRRPLEKYIAVTATAAVIVGGCTLGPTACASTIYGVQQGYDAYNSGASLGDSLKYGVAKGFQAYSVLSSAQGFYNSAVSEGIGGVIKTGASQYAKKKFREEVARFAEDQFGMSAEKFNLTLFAISLAGQSRMHFVKKQGYSPDVEYDLAVINGFGDRYSTWGYGTYFFDVVDTILAYQGLPTATSVDYVLNAKGLPIDAHSLGTIDSTNLLAYGFATEARLAALPFGNIGPAGAEVTINSGDFVNGYFLGMIFNPWAQMIDVTPTANNTFGHGSCPVYNRCYSF